MVLATDSAAGGGGGGGGGGGATSTGGTQQQRKTETAAATMITMLSNAGSSSSSTKDQDKASNGQLTTPVTNTKIKQTGNAAVSRTTKIKKEEKVVQSKAPTLKANPLPEGWASTIDPKTGDIYYYHAKRQISQWDRPTEKDNMPLDKSFASLEEWGFGVDDSKPGTVPVTPAASSPSSPGVVNVPDVFGGSIGLDFHDTIGLSQPKNLETSSLVTSNDPWDAAAPAGLTVSKKKKGPMKPQTIIEEIIEAAARAGGDAAYNSNASVSDDRASELLEPIEYFLNENFFPMKYQLAWLDFFLTQKFKGGVFADDMGLGKTYSVWLAVIHDNPPRRGDRKTLLIANNHAVLTQWRGELAKFFQNIPSWYTLAWIGEERWDEDAARKFEDAQVILTTKDIVVSDFQVHSPYWMAENSKSKDGKSCVMFAPVDGEPQVNRENPKEDNHLIKRRRDARERGRTSLLFSRKYGASNFDLVFVDEGDMIRAETDHTTPGQVRKRSWQAVWNLHCDRTWIMTGTPVNNNATGLLSLFELGRCGTSLPKKVQGLWVKDGSRMLTFMEQVRRLNWVRSNTAMVEALRILQKTNFIRRTIDMKEIQLQNADYGRPLPRCRYVDCPVTVGRGEDVYFATVETNTTDALSSWLKMDSSARYDSWHRVWQGMTKARQVAALNPRIGLQPAGTVDVTKFEEYPISEKEKVILGICQAAVRKNEQVVIATLFVDCNVRLVALLKRHNIVAERFDGKLNQKLRQSGMEDFQSGRSSVMVMLMFAGGRGLNLQNANHLILTSPWWNPVVLDQTRRRVWRVGSPHKIVTMYNVFYDISVEQWMLQTRIKSKMMLAASLLNEEAIYGGEEAITTQRSKKELSQTLQTQKLDEMWDFLSFLRAAPTARTEIRGVENVVWSEEMMSHPLVGPRCRQMMITLFICVKRASKSRNFPTLPVDIWKQCFRFLYGQDFAPVPAQKIESKLETDDKISLVKQQNAQKLNDINNSLAECKEFLTDLHFKRVAAADYLKRKKGPDPDFEDPDEEIPLFDQEDVAMVTDLLDRQRQLYQIRQLLDNPIATGLSIRANKGVLWLDPNPRMPQHGETSSNFLKRAGPVLEKSQREQYTALQYLEFTAQQQAAFSATKGGDTRLEDIGYMDDDPMVGDVEVDGDDDLMSDDEGGGEDDDSDDDGLEEDEDEEEEDITELPPLDQRLAVKIEEGMLKYLNRKPSTKDQLIKKLKPLIKQAEEKGQVKQAEAFMTTVFGRTCAPVVIDGEPHWELKVSFRSDGVESEIGKIRSASSSPVKALPFKRPKIVADPVDLDLDLDDGLFDDIV